MHIIKYLCGGEKCQSAAHSLGRFYYARATADLHIKKRKAMRYLLSRKAIHCVALIELKRNALWGNTHFWSHYLRISRFRTIRYAFPARRAVNVHIDSELARASARITSKLTYTPHEYISWPTLRQTKGETVAQSPITRGVTRADWDAKTTLK